MRYRSAIVSLVLFWLALSPCGAAEILWAQYCQHLGIMKMMVHLNCAPDQPESQLVSLWVQRDGKWQSLGTEQMFTLTATVLFEMKEWPRQEAIPYKVTCGDSSLEGVFRAEPEGTPLRMMGISCIKEIGWPWKEAIEAMIKADPDQVYFSGDQIYEDDYGSEHMVAKTSGEIYQGMANYLAKYRRFGLAFRDLLKDRPSIMITDDHDVYANDLWGNGGRTMSGDRTTGGYRCHPNWVNAVEHTQTDVLPDAVNKGSPGDGIFAYYTALEVRRGAIRDFGGPQI